MARNIIVIGASAGGVQALQELVAGLPADLKAAVFVVLHISPYGRSALPEILGRVSALPVRHPDNGEIIQPGRVYVAPPDWHLVVGRRRLRLSHGPTENGHRPAVDVLFRTAARAFGERVVGVVLTGNLDDGTSGLSFVKHHGGIAVVQDPEEADYPGMPASALRNVAVDHVVPLGGIAPLLTSLTNNSHPFGEAAADPADDAEESQLRTEPEFEIEPEAKPSGLTCPECGGSLWESTAPGPLHFRCRTGHAFSPESLAAEQSETLEAALWAAIRSLEENAALARGMAERLRRSGNGLSMERFVKKAQAADQHVAQIRRVLYQTETDPDMD
jgi:two-component system chemotaxis response regulator CheB